MFAARALSVGRDLMGNFVLRGEGGALAIQYSHPSEAGGMVVYGHKTHLHIKQNGKGLQKTERKRRRQQRVVAAIIYVPDNGRAPLTAQTHATHKSNIHDVVVAETHRTEIDRVLRRHGERCFSQ